MNKAAYETAVDKIARGIEVASEAGLSVNQVIQDAADLAVKRSTDKAERVYKAAMSGAPVESDR